MPLLPTAMTFSRHWVYSQGASSITSALFTEGMARKSKVSKLLTAGKRAERIRRSTIRWWRSMSSSSASRSRQAEWSTFSAAHCAAIFLYSRRKVGSLSSLRWYSKSSVGLSVMLPSLKEGSCSLRRRSCSLSSGADRDTAPGRGGAACLPAGTAPDALQHQS